MYAFGSSQALTADQLAQAPIRYPKPSRLARPLRVGGAKAARAAEALGLRTVGDLLEHLPRDRREARTVAKRDRGRGGSAHLFAVGTPAWDAAAG
jgi:ATP-dependent DNA helicase RecG